MAIFSSGVTKEDSPAPTQLNRRKSDQVPLSIIARDLTITGDLESDGVVKIEGRVKGTVRAATQVLVSPGARVEGDIHTKEAIVAGEVLGTTRAGERVELQATAVVNGDIVTPRIAMVEGCRLTGEVKMESSHVTTA